MNNKEIDYDETDYDEIDYDDYLERDDEALREMEEQEEYEQTQQYIKYLEQENEEQRKILKTLKKHIFSYTSIEYNPTNLITMGVIREGSEDFKPVKEWLDK